MIRLNNRAAFVNPNLIYDHSEDVSSFKEDTMLLKRLGLNIHLSHYVYQIFDSLEKGNIE